MRKRALHAAGVDIDHHAPQGKDTRLYEISDSRRDRPARIAWKRAVHIHAVEGRSTRVCDAGTFAQLRHEYHSPSHLLRIEICTKALHADLTLVLIPMGAAETNYAVCI